MSIYLIFLALVSFTRMYHPVTRETPEVMLLSNKRNLETSKVMTYLCGPIILAF